MLNIIETTAGFDVTFQYKPFLVEGIKMIPGARWYPPEKKWKVPAEGGTALLNWAKNFGVVPKQSEVVVEIGEIEPLPELQQPVPEYFYNRDKKAKGQPCDVMPYQKTGVAYSLQKKRVIVGDQPGLGKTVQAILTTTLANCKCILVICPATLRENWKREFKLWANKEALILTDRIKTSWVQYYNVGYCNVFIVNYESLKKYFVKSINRPIGKDGKEVPLRLNHIVFNDTIQQFDAIIIDEVHRCKDGKTQQAKFVMGISKGKEYVLALTGTPVVNKPIDLIPQLHIINRLEEFGGYKGFVNNYCQGPTGASNLKQLNFLMHKSCFYRREKSEVLSDLPAKMRNIVRIDITNRAEYLKAENEFIEYLRENLNKSEEEIDTALRGAIMVQLGILKKISARGKITDVVEHIAEVTEAGEKIVVFAWHKEMVQELKQAIPNAVTIVGDDTMEQRQKAVDQFQNNKDTQVILCNIKSGGVGITLTASSRVAFVELPWHPADCEQCEDRCHRIGQRDSVECTYFLGHETVDEYIYRIIEKKRNIVNQVTGAQDTIETNMVDEFINLFKTKKL